MSAATATSVNAPPGLRTPIASTSAPPDDAEARQLVHDEVLDARVGHEARVGRLVALGDRAQRVQMRREELPIAGDGGSPEHHRMPYARLDVVQHAVREVTLGG